MTSEIHPDILAAVTEMANSYGTTDWKVESLLSKKLLRFNVRRDKSTSVTRKYGSFQTTTCSAIVEWVAGSVWGRFQMTVGPRNDHSVLSAIGRDLERTVNANLSTLLTPSNH